MLARLDTCARGEVDITCTSGLEMSSFTTFLGILALLGGTVQMLGRYSLDGALLLIILGAYLLLKPWFDKRQLY